jgi:hypothetical protein
VFGGDRQGLAPDELAGLSVADGFLGAPAQWTDQDWRNAASALGDDGVAELVLLLTKFSRNKVRVALGLDLSEIALRPY